VLGVREVVFLGYRDGELASVDAAEAVARIGREIQRVRPDVVVTFDQNGLYGHPDHIAISRLTTTAVVAASQVDFLEAEGPVTHLVPKLYYMAWTQRAVALYESAFGELRMEVEGHTRQPSPWPDWALTTRIDASDHWRRAWEAIERHQSQLPAYDRLLELPAAFHRELWSNVGYYRALSLVNVVSDTEDDLFAGLR
jgi:LmbE family N-acetylglucosaminyl deacetylase